MYTVYILRSYKTGKIYTGFTQRPIEERLAEHNSGQTISTKHGAPYQLIRTEIFQTRELASNRERFLKSGKGRSIIHALINAGKGNHQTSSL